MTWLGFSRLTRWSMAYLVVLLVLIAVTIVPENYNYGAYLALYILGAPAIPVATVVVWISGALLFSVERDDWAVTVWACLVLSAAAVVQAHALQEVGQAISRSRYRRRRHLSRGPEHQT